MIGAYAARIAMRFHVLPLMVRRWWGAVERAPSTLANDERERPAALHCGR
jgi:hypothetical protein